MPLPRSAAGPLASGLWLAEPPSSADDASGAAAVAAALALDEALLEEAHEGLRQARVVRVWEAPEPVVVVGSSSRVEEEVDLAACAAAGVPVLRRPSGGATVILGPGCLMWSVVEAFPLGVPAVERIHEAMLGPLAAALSDGGPAVARLGTSDLVLAGAREEEARKVSGNALRVRRHGVLYHGTLLDSFDIGLAGRLLRHPPREPGYRVRRPHEAFLANLGMGRSRLERLVRGAFGAERTFPLAQVPHGRVERLLRERYALPAWTHRL